MTNLIERKAVPLTSQKGSSSPPLKGKTIWIAAAAVLSIFLAGYVYYTKVFTATENSDPLESQAAIVQSGDLTVSASGTGTLIAETEASFGFDTSGQVAAVYVQVGDQVEAGQVLAQLDDTLARMEYDEAQRNLQELYSAASVAAIQEEIASHGVARYPRF